MNRIVSGLFRVSIVLVMAFITLPLIVVMAASLSPSSQVTLVPWEWTVRWYGDLVARRWIDPFILSAQIAVLVSWISGVLGLLAAYVVAFEKCPGHAAIMSFLLSPLAVPQVVKGLSIVLFLSSAGLYPMAR
ncbi:ABC transporter permease, partial [Devosia psychrophila]